MTTVKTRFAPSPTGFLHVGSARTALFNWLYARNQGGEFILRIEDTDLERSKKEFEIEILESLTWLGLNWDGDMKRQSERNPIYHKYAEQLLQKDLAYREGDAIRFKSPKSNIFWFDLVKGKIEFDGGLFDDLVIMKSNGTPTYSFACVVDDGEMQISHIIRGEDHISNTPKQLPLYDALGFKPPKFAHIPLILGEDRSRLSKRHGATSIRDFKQAGYLPQAMINYLCLLGWSPGNNQELISLENMVEKFSVKKIQTTNAIFDTKKMDWMNGEYIRNLDIAKLSELFFNILEEAGKNIEPYDQEWRHRFSELYRKRIFLLQDLVVESAFFFEEGVTIAEDGMEILKKDVRLASLLDKYADALSDATQFDHEHIESVTRAFMESQGVSGKEFIHPARIAATGRTVSPGFFETLSLLGKNIVVTRIKKTAHSLKINSPSVT